MERCWNGYKSTQFGKTVLFRPWTIKFNLLEVKRFECSLWSSIRSDVIKLDGWKWHPNAGIWFVPSADQSSCCVTIFGTLHSSQWLLYRPLATNQCKCRTIVISIRLKMDKTSKCTKISFIDKLPIFAPYQHFRFLPTASKRVPRDPKKVRIGAKIICSWYI